MITHFVTYVHLFVHLFVFHLGNIRLLIITLFWDVTSIIM